MPYTPQASEHYWLEIGDECSLYDLAIVIPAYNEASRITAYLESIKAYIKQLDINVQLIVVNDGSTDNTSTIVKECMQGITNPLLDLIELEFNQGKGNAVRTGLLASRAKLVLFTDADGSSPIEEIEKLVAALDNGASIAIGSRAVPGSELSLKTVWYRKLLGRSFNLFVNLLLLPDYYDTQCGFKLFKAEAAHKLAFLQQLRGFSFDLELLFLAKKLNFPVNEVSINWHNVAGSKVNLALDSLKMFKNLVRIRYLWKKRLTRKLD